VPMKTPCGQVCPHYIRNKERGNATAVRNQSSIAVE